MRSQTVLRRVVCLAAAAWMAFGTLDTVCAQRAGAGYQRPGASEAVRAEEQLRVRQLTAVGNQGKIKTPVFRTNLPSGIKPIGDWAQIMATYDTFPEWLDEIVFQYHVMTFKREGAPSQYSLFRKVVRYGDIKRDRGHMSTVFLHPRTLERFGDVVAAAVEISIDGKLVAEETDIEPRAQLPADWWKNPSVLQSQTVAIRDGYLLNRAESPFAFINVDDYELIKR